MDKHVVILFKNVKEGSNFLAEQSSVLSPHTFVLRTSLIKNNLNLNSCQMNASLASIYIFWRLPPKQSWHCQIVHEPLEITQLSCNCSLNEFKYFRMYWSVRQTSSFFLRLASSLAGSGMGMSSGAFRDARSSQLKDVWQKTKVKNVIFLSTSLGTEHTFTLKCI